MNLGEEMVESGKLGPDSVTFYYGFLLGVKLISAQHGVASWWTVLATFIGGAAVTVLCWRFWPAVVQKEESR